MKYQRGVALSGVIFWGMFLAVIAIFGLKVVPTYINYYSIIKSVKAVAAGAAGKTVADIRNDFSKQVQAGYFTEVQAADLDISKSGNEVVIAFAYEKRVPLFANISLLIDFNGSSVRN